MSRIRWTRLLLPLLGMGSLLNLGFVFHICFCTVLFADRTQENIKSVVIAVLLSPKLQAYKGDTPKDGVLVHELPLSQKSYTLLYLLNRPFFLKKSTTSQRTILMMPAYKIRLRLQSARSSFRHVRNLRRL